jgi:hypothetical protein
LWGVSRWKQPTEIAACRVQVVSGDLPMMGQLGSIPDTLPAGELVTPKKD